MLSKMKALVPFLFLGLTALFAGCSQEPSEFPFELFSWESSTPEEEGMDGQKLDSAFIYASGYGFVDALLLIRNGRIVAEDYYNGFSKDHPLVYDPGERMSFNTFNTDLLSGVISKATGQSTYSFARRQLFAPMGIDVDYWEQDPQGIYFGGNSMHVSPREMAAFGLMYLQNGMLRGKQIIPQAWVEFSLSPSTDLAHPNECGSWKNYNNAYLWWLGQFSGYDSFMGYAYGGQFLIVFPDLDLIVVSTAKNDVPPETSTEQEWTLFDPINDYILASLN